jgi:Undecaprenyl-phosphate galactose phosphotransferase WbaP
MQNAITGQEMEIKIESDQRQAPVLDEYARPWMTLALALSDLLSLYLALALALQIRRLPGLVVDLDYNQVYGLLAVTLLLMFARKGLYPAVGFNYVDELGQVVSSASFSFLVVIVITFALEHGSLTLRLVMLLAWAFSLGLIPAARYLVRRLLIRWRLWGEPVVVIGDLKAAQTLAEHFRINLQLGLRPVALLPTERCAGCQAGCNGPEVTCPVRAQARGLKLQTALVAIDDLGVIDDLVERFRGIFHRVILVKHKAGRYGLSGLQVLDFSQVLGLEVRNNLLNPWAQLFKRAIDLLGAGVGLLCLAPLFGLLALWIRLDAPGGVFYRQARLGRHGRPFQLLKFRSMYRDADQVLSGELARDPALKAEWDSHQKLKRDPRITRAGRFLRKFSLDEFPQLWNVLRGEMSLVGPRPIMLNQRLLYGETFGDYSSVAPGMTGLWQVSGRSQTTFARRAELDLEYIQRWSLWLDIYILVKTVKVVLWEKSAY